MFTVSAVSNSSSASQLDIFAARITAELDRTYEDGTYTGVGTGFNYGLTVEITIENNQIIEIDVTNHNETLGYYETAFVSVPNSILSSQSLDVDTVSGATRSSEGIIEAVEEAYHKVCAH